MWKPVFQIRIDTRPVSPRRFHIDACSKGGEGHLLIRAILWCGLNIEAMIRLLGISVLVAVGSIVVVAVVPVYGMRDSKKRRCQEDHQRAQSYGDEAHGIPDDKIGLHSTTNRIAKMDNTLPTDEGPPSVL